MSPVDEYSDMPELRDVSDDSSVDEPLSRLFLHRGVDVNKSGDPEARRRIHPPSGSEAIVLPGRHGRLPVMYRVNSHPQLSHVDGVRNIYIYLEDTDPDSMLEYLEFVEQLVLPDGTQKGVQEAGYLVIAPGDYIFARDVWGSGKAEDDVVQAWVTPEGLIVGSLAEEMSAARDAVLGTAEDRSPQKATIVNGEYVGGIAWERDSKAVNIHNSERAYSLAQSYQIQKNLAGPTVGAKIPATEPTEHNNLRHQTIQAAAPIAITSLESGPRGLCDALRLQAEVTNMPRVGYEGNYAFPTMQLNIASTKSSDTLAAAHFKDDLGQFAGKHVDKHDSAGGYTCMIAMNDLAEGEDPGYFMIAELGVAIVLNGLVSCCFSGLRYHGGFPPTAPAGVTPPDWSYRFVVVCYPSASILDGSSLVAFGALPKGELLAITPEMKDPSYDHVKAGTNCANWIADGPCLTTRQAYLDFIYRASGELVYYLTNQIPSDIQFELDFDVLRQSMSLLDESGGRITPTAWDLHPGSSHKSAVFDCSRKDSVKLWNEHKKKLGKFMPHYVFTETKPDEHPRLKNARTGRSTHKTAKAKHPPAAKKPLQDDAADSGEDADEDQDEDDWPEEDELNPWQSDDSENDHAARLARPSTLEKGKRKEISLSDESSRKSKRLRMNSAQTEQDYNGLVPGASEQAGGSGSSGTLHIEVGHGILQDVHEPRRVRVLAVKPNSDQVSFKESAIAASTFVERNVNPDPSIGEPFALSDVPASQRRGFEDTVLHVFTLPRLQEQLACLKHLAVRVEELNNSEYQTPGIDSFFDSLQHAPRASFSFARDVAELWHVWSLHEELLEIADLTLAVERRRLMVSNAAAWLWLTQDCMAHTRAVVADLQMPSNSPVRQTPVLDDWLATLVRDIYALWSTRQGGDLLASRYLPGLSVVEESIHVPRISANQSQVADAICVEVIKIIRNWLAFPSNTQLLSAYFVVYLVATLKNVDVLLFSDIWHFHQSMKTLLFGHTGVNLNSIRHQSLKISLLTPLLQALRECPAADPCTEEAETLRQITAAVTCCSPTLQGFAQAIETLLNISSGCPDAPSIAIPGLYRKATRQLLDGSSKRLQPGEPSGSQAPGPLPPMLPPADGVVPQQSHLCLLALVRDLIPLARDPTHTATTPSQRLVSSHLDHYLPFREHAPTRQTVTSEGGPFHHSLASKPGGFASQAMSRALLFDSPAIHQHLTKGYFADVAAWSDFIMSQGYDGTLHSISGLVNISCYGSAQWPRVQTLTDVSPYFAREAAWHTLLKSGQVQFTVCLDWLQLTYPGVREGGRDRPVKYLPLLGPLTAYLLTADLVYSGHVAAPTVTELGVIIHNNNLGSRNCLGILAPQCSSTANVTTIVTAFQEVYTFLSDALTAEEKAAITFDPIMVEHLLCKYQRIQCRLGTVKKPKKGGKGRK